VSEEKEFRVTASTTITATFVVYAESEEDAKDEVESAVLLGAHAFDYSVSVSDAEEVGDTGWQVEDIAVK